MAQKEFDPTLKTLSEPYPRDWSQAVCSLLGLPYSRQVDVIDSDVSTVTAAGDKVFRVGGRRSWILNLEFVSSHNARLAKQTMLYNVVLGDRYDLPVESVVVLLRPEADRGSLTGVYRREGVDGGPCLEFHYRIVRVWQVPAESFLNGGIGVLALAAVANVTEQRLPAVLRQMETRLASDATAEQTQDVWAATYVLLGLNHSKDFVRQLFRGVRGMRESSTYQAILEEERAEGAIRNAREMLLRLGKKRLGEPDSATRAAIEAIADAEVLNNMVERLDAGAGWGELLPTPSGTSKRSRKKSS